MESGLYCPPPPPCSKDESLTLDLVCKAPAGWPLSHATLASYLVSIHTFQLAVPPLNQISLCSCFQLGVGVKGHSVSKYQDSLLQTVKVLPQMLCYEHMLKGCEGRTLPSHALGEKPSSATHCPSHTGMLILPLVQRTLNGDNYSTQCKVWFKDQDSQWI